MEHFAGHVHLQAVDHAGFGADDELLGRILTAVTDHARCALHGVCGRADLGRALRVDHHPSPRESLPGRFDIFQLNGFVGGTKAFPQDHGASGLLLYPGTQIAIRGEDHFAILGYGRHHGHGIGAGAADMDRALTAAEVLT